MNPIHVYTKTLPDDTFAVYWGTRRDCCEGMIHVDIQDPKLTANHEDAAELAAITEIISNLGLNISPTGKGLVITCSGYEIPALKEKTSDLAYLGLYAHLLATQFGDAEVAWSADKSWLDNKTEKYQEYSLKITKPPIKKEPCPLLGGEVIITRHAIRRAVERQSSLKRTARAYQALAKALSDPSLVELRQSAMRTVHNDLSYEKQSRALYHSSTNLVLTVVPQDDGWAITTCTQRVKSRSYVD